MWLQGRRRAGSGSYPQREWLPQAQVPTPIDGTVAIGAKEPARGGADRHHPHRQGLTDAMILPAANREPA